MSRYLTQPGNEVDHFQINRISYEPEAHEVVINDSTEGRCGSVKLAWNNRRGTILIQNKQEFVKYPPASDIFLSRFVLAKLGLWRIGKAIKNVDVEANGVLYHMDFIPVDDSLPFIVLKGMPCVPQKDSTAYVTQSEMTWLERATTTPTPTTFRDWGNGSQAIDCQLLADAAYQPWVKARDELAENVRRKETGVPFVGVIEETLQVYLAERDQYGEAATQLLQEITRVQQDVLDELRKSGNLPKDEQRHLMKLAEEIYTIATWSTEEVEEQVLEKISELRSHRSYEDELISSIRSQLDAFQRQYKGYKDRCDARSLDTRASPHQRNSKMYVKDISDSESSNANQQLGQVIKIPGKRAYLNQGTPLCLNKSISNQHIPIQKEKSQKRLEASSIPKVSSQGTRNPVGRKHRLTLKGYQKFRQSRILQNRSRFQNRNSERREKEVCFVITASNAEPDTRTESSVTDPPAIGDNPSHQADSTLQNIEEMLTMTQQLTTQTQSLLNIMEYWVRNMRLNERRESQKFEKAVQTGNSSVEEDLPRSSENRKERVSTWLNDMRGSADADCGRSAADQGANPEAADPSAARALSPEETETHRKYDTGDPLSADEQHGSTMEGTKEVGIDYFREKRAEIVKKGKLKAEDLPEFSEESGMVKSGQNEPKCLICESLSMRGRFRMVGRPLSTFGDENVVHREKDEECSSMSFRTVPTDNITNECMEYTRSGPCEALEKFPDSLALSEPDFSSRSGRNTSGNTEINQADITVEDATERVQNAFLKKDSERECSKELEHRDSESCGRIENGVDRRPRNTTKVVQNHEPSGYKDS